jgi:two-component system, NarL family, response regulator
MSKSNSPIRILVADDHPVVQAGLTSMLNSNDGIEVVGSASSGTEALKILEQKRPDILLLDLRMPGMNGIETLTAMQKMNTTTRAIVLTSFETDENIYRAVRAGAQGYLLKDAPQEQMLEAIVSVHAGKRFIPKEIAARLADRMMRSNLTARELEILEMLAKGLTNKQIGCALTISENTVRNHLKCVMGKLDVSDRTEAVAVAIQQGILQIRD